MKSYTILDFSNVLPNIISSYYKDFPYNKSQKVPLKIEVSVEDDLFDAFTKDPTWLQKAHEKVKSAAETFLRDANEGAKNGALNFAKQGGKSAKEVETKYFIYLALELKAAQKTLTLLAAKIIQAISKQYEKAKEDLHEMRVKSAGKLAVTGVSTACSVVLTILTGGAAAPLFIISMAKTAASIAQECAKLASTVDTNAAYIRKELTILSTFLQDSNYDLFEKREKFAKLDLELETATATYKQLQARILEVQQRIGKEGKTKEQDAKNKKKFEEARKSLESNAKERAALEKKIKTTEKEIEKIEAECNAPKGFFRKYFKSGRKSATEIGLATLSKVIGLETPSLENCKGHIELHAVTIGKVRIRSHELSTSLYSAMDKQKETLSDIDRAFAEAHKGIAAKFAQILEKNKDLPDAAKKYNAAEKKVKTQLETAKKNFLSAVTKAEKLLANLIKDIIEANEKIESSVKLNKHFSKSIELLSKGVPDSLKYVSTVLGIATGAGLGFADGGFLKSTTDLAATISDAVNGLAAEIGSIVIDEL